MIVQGSPEWFAVRLGKVTASRVGDVIAKTKTGYGASRANYMAELIAERLTGVPAESYTNGAIQWGVDHEAEARAAYAFRMNIDVEEVGFVPHPSITMSGASPDGLVGDLGLVEIKCPNTATHIDTLLSRAVPRKYVAQVQWQMACTARQMCDFVSYDPRLPEEMRLVILPVYRGNAYIDELTKEVTDFLAELDAKLARLSLMYMRAEEAA